MVGLHSRLALLRNPSAWLNPEKAVDPPRAAILVHNAGVRGTRIKTTFGNGMHDSIMA